MLLPNYAMLPASLLQTLEHAAFVVVTSTDEAGEFYAMMLAKSFAAVVVEHNSTIVLPVTPPQNAQAIDFTYLAASKSVFIALHEKP